MDPISFSALCVLIGCIAGFLGGLLGIGGGIVIVPALIALLDGSLPGTQVTPVAVATSLAGIVFISLSAALAQARSGQVDWLIARRWVLGLVVGGIAAGPIAVALPLPVFRSCIGAFLLFVSFVMMTQWRPAPQRALPGVMASLPLGACAGVISGIAGIGGGNVIVPTLIFFNTPVHRATATASGLGLPVALAGTLGFMLSPPAAPVGQGVWGHIHLHALVPIVLSAVVAAPLGVRCAARIRPLPLRRAFGVLLIVAAGRMLWTAFRHA
ncbi:MAG: sulfite exporter TauE/SafE family protein [Pseudomonadales bacterium]